MDLPPRELARRSRLASWRSLLHPALIAAALVLLATAAIVDWPKSDPQARRQLSLRAAELEAWLRQELLTPIERSEFAVAGGAPDSARAWRVLFAEVEKRAAQSLADGVQLPALERGGALAIELDLACGARHFTAFDSVESLLGDEWLQDARLLTTLLDRAVAPPDGTLADWLDAAVVFAADLRATALLEPALHAARLEEAVLRRLERPGEPLDGAALRRVRDHAGSARATLPAAALLAERESRFVQATICMHADIAPFRLPRERQHEGESWPLIPAAAAVEELEIYDELLAGLLAEPQDQRARSSFERWIEKLTNESPRATALLADGGLLLPVRDAAKRLERIAAAAAFAAPGVDRAERRQ
ncbi:MAG: hypothetical protein EXR73_00905 [Myxococcales bacterium]|nr:hypothetical protein [Myxococcales bacterium]